MNLCPENVVAFLQNPWFREGTREDIIARYATEIAFRRRVLAGSMTGRRLRRAFGIHWYDRMWWDNANPRHASDHRGKFGPDVPHMIRVLTDRAPIVVLTFGRVARDGVELALSYMNLRTPVLACHHPNAMGKTQEDLDLFALAVRNAIL